MNRLFQISVLVPTFLSAAAMAQHNGDIGLVIESQKLSSVVISGGEYSANEQIFTASFGDSGYD